MTSETTAPVDQVRSLEKLESTPDNQFRILISLMLSARTRDEVTDAVMKVLIDKYSLSVDVILETPEATLATQIDRVGFYNQKAKHIKQATQIIKEKHRGKVPTKYDDLIALPGVGPKMAHLVLQEAFGSVQGIAVDTHIHRISERLGWASDAQTAGQTADQLESWLPFEHWAQVSMLVALGQTICRPVNPKCNECKVNDLCPYNAKSKPPSVEQSQTSTKRKREVEESLKETKLDKLSLSNLDVFKRVKK